MPWWSEIIQVASVIFGVVAVWVGLATLRQTQVMRLEQCCPRFDIIPDVSRPMESEPDVREWIRSSLILVNTGSAAARDVCFIREGSNIANVNLINLSDTGTVLPGRDFRLEFDWRLSDAPATWHLVLVYDASIGCLEQQFTVSTYEENGRWGRCTLDYIKGPRVNNARRVWWEQDNQ